MSLPYAEVIGDPVAHSKSPGVHEFWLGKLTIEAEYRATALRAGELGSYLEVRRADPLWRGCNLTMPHKRAALLYVDRREDDNVGAINCIVPRPEGLVGFNTDIFGVQDALDHVETGAPICLIGAGGAARAAIAGLDLFAVFQFHVVARNRSEGEKLIADFGMMGRVFDFGSAADALDGAAGVINVSPLGMTGFPEMPDTVTNGLAGIRRGGFVFDMVYQPVQTELLKAAAAIGLRTVDGLAMLIGQAAAAFELFFSAAPPRVHDAELRAMLLR